MIGECCPECGHLLSKSRKACLFCEWDESIGKYSRALRLENDLSYSDAVYIDSAEIRPDQFPGF